MTVCHRWSWRWEPQARAARRSPEKNIISAQLGNSSSFCRCPFPVPPSSFARPLGPGLFYRFPLANLRAPCISGLYLSAFFALFHTTAFSLPCVCHWRTKLTHHLVSVSRIPSADIPRYNCNELSLFINLAVSRDNGRLLGSASSLEPSFKSSYGSH